MKKSNEGITLIALVITIIVLLILAGISIMMLTGENSILKQATNAQKNTIEGTEREAIAVAYNGVLTDKLGSVTEGEDFRKDLEDELKNNGNNVAVSNNGKTVTFTDTGHVYTLTIATGEIKGPKTPAARKALGDAYDNGDIQIGSKLTYSANGQSNWIVFGKDEDGNVLITTDEPVANGFTLKNRAKNWLSYEEDLHEACSVYGGTVQGKAVTARSITMDDINRVTGFDEVLETITFDEYTFGKTIADEDRDTEFANKKVDFYYPCEDEAQNQDHPYWRKATVDTLTATGTDVPAAEFHNNFYVYYKIDYEETTMSEYIYFPDGETTTGTMTLNNMRYITGYGTESSYLYAVATRFVSIKNNKAIFSYGLVGDGYVGMALGAALCYSRSNSFSNDEEGSAQISSRPVVVLPSNLQVEEQEGGAYDLVQ